MNINTELDRKSKTYGFVVLHYMAYDMTKECVETLQKQFKNYNYEVVIVDNFSPNNSGAKLQGFFAGDENVHVLLNASNEGFARGNNVGYKYLRDNYPCDYIIVINNDVIIDQNDFLEQIDYIYEKSRFDVLGPDIFCPATGLRQNPSRMSGLSMSRVDSLLKSYTRWCKHPLLHYYKDLIDEKRLHKDEKNVNGIEDINRDLEYKNVVLHGACYIFSKKYIEKRSVCFCPETFLYMEEDILYFQCMLDNMVILYDPSVKIRHLEDVATNASIKSAYRKKKMKYFQTMKSLQVLSQLMHEVEETNA